MKMSCSSVLSVLCALLKRGMKGKGGSELKRWRYVCAHHWVRRFSLITLRTLRILRILWLNGKRENMRLVILNRYSNTSGWAFPCTLNSDYVLKIPISWTRNTQNALMLNSEYSECWHPELRIHRMLQSWSQNEPNGDAAAAVNNWTGVLGTTSTGFDQDISTRILPPEYFHQNISTRIFPQVNRCAGHYFKRLRPGPDLAQNISTSRPALQIY